MLKIIFISLFSSFFEVFAKHSIVEKAINKGKTTLVNIDLRDFGLGKNQQVDEYQTGPGRGMVLMVEPLYQALQVAKKQSQGETAVILLSARGKSYTQKEALFLSTNYQTLILISGNYEGVDERIINYIDYEFSIGNYVLTGGEIPALVIANSLIRLLKGVIHPESQKNESFMTGLLDYPVYTKPHSFHCYDTPAILLSGNHQKIANWRRKKAILKTYQNNPNLLKETTLTEEEETFLEKNSPKS